MAVDHIHTFLVHPGKRTEGPLAIRGTAVRLEGKLFKILDEIYSRSMKECDIDISFNHSTDGKQQNPCRDVIVRYLEEPNIDRGRDIAERLEKVTDQRSGLGLLLAYPVYTHTH